MVKVRSQFSRVFGKRTVIILFLSFLFYCLITVVIHYFSFIHPHPADADVKHFQDLAVALWANVIFAGTFGLLAAVISLFKPEEDTLEKRIGYLYPRSSTLSGDARTRLGKNAMKLAAPAIGGELHFVIETFDADKNAFLVYVYINFTLRNILQEEYYEDEIEILVVPDAVPGIDELGRLIESTVVCSDAEPTRVVHFISHPITAHEKRFQQFVTVTIPPKAEAIHSYSFSSWSFQSVPFIFHAQRYSENVQVRVTNRCGAQITCILSKGTNNPTVSPEVLVSTKLANTQEATLKQGLVLDGNRDNIQLVIHV